MKHTYILAVKLPIDPHNYQHICRRAQDPKLNIIGKEVEFDGSSYTLVYRGPETAARNISTVLRGGTMLACDIELQQLVV
jgi:hypothetical protein